MRICSGTLVVHRDGTPARCSQESSPMGCPDRSYRCHRAFAPCRLAGSGCALCVEVAALVADGRRRNPVGAMR